jgi:hypothetical protein
MESGAAGAVFVKPPGPRLYVSEGWGPQNGEKN